MSSLIMVVVFANYADYECLIKVIVNLVLRRACADGDSVTLKKTLDGLTPNQRLRLTAAIDSERQETLSTKNVAQLPF